MSNIDRRSEAGVVGKAAAIWLTLIAVLAVAGVDAVAIARTTLHASEIAADAASAGETVFRTQGQDVTSTCEAVASYVESRDRDLRLGRNGCQVDVETDTVTVTVRTTADTFLVGRFGPTQDYTQITVSEANGRSGL